MSTSQKRKAEEDNIQLSSKSFNKKNRASINNDQTISGNSNPTITQPHYSPLSYSHRPSSSDTPQIWNPTDSLNSSFSSTSSNSDYDSISQSSSYRLEMRNQKNSTTVSEELSAISNISYQPIMKEDHDSKRELSPPLNHIQPQKKKMKADGTSTLKTSEAVDKMMQKMGYDKNRGLGLNAQGPTKIIEESKQKGHRGLGYTNKGFNDITAEWDFDTDPAPIEEEVHWCPSSDQSEIPLNLDDMREWIKLGPKKRVIDDEIEFCDESILKEMLNGKSIFDELAQKEMEEARTRSNVYEIIGQSIFLNRAAVKMANIDAVFGRMFTDPKTPNNQRSLVHPDEPFYFADICAGPGGFSEYILWKKQWRAKGFGFTLRGKSDFALHKFLAGAPETFDLYYGVKDIEGDGDIFKSENIDALQNYVNKCTMHQGVHIVMADGGFSVEGQENIQEILSKQLYLCQFLTALSILRPGGHFVCKLFDIFTPFSVGLVYLMYRTFDKISIHKPVTSRPANSERYIICKGLRGDVRDIVRAYMYEINALQNKYGIDSESNDVESIVPMDILKGNESFNEYIRKSNDDMGEHQIRNLKKIRAFVSNTSLKDPRQHDIRLRCLEYWQLPNEPRQKPKRLMCDEVQYNLFQQLENGVNNMLLNTPNLFKNSVLDQHRIQSLFDYRCVFSLGDPVLLLSCGRGFVFSRALKTTNKQWSPLQKGQFKIELPPYTLVLAELVQEQFSDGRNIRQRPAVYIIDAYYIGSENMLSQNGQPVVFMDRYRSLKLFEKTINKPARIDLVPIRISDQLRMEQMDVQFEKLCPPDSLKQIDNEKLFFTNTNIPNKPRVSVCGLWIFKFVQHPWTLILSKSTQSKYFHNQVTRASLQHAPPDSSHVAPLKSMLENSFYWDFNSRDDSVQKSNFISFIHGKNHELQSQQRISNHTTTSGSH
ncbi:unnamed protein product [Adineta steineri]|uniref:Cap-specific mRNA (nucleoside-2'-O-)-methyltransferase 1 n=1 Tax=Adineta steineri TaxID=433720 RepID=A0A813PBU5_9BILA|nr:unnamed protein product [Adineta steineri]CAF3476136.1 unnamed protein product [Adineta steineri]